MRRDLDSSVRPSLAMALRSAVMGVLVGALVVGSTSGCGGTSADVSESPALGEPASVHTPLGDGVSINWTEGTLEATTRAEGRGIGGTRKAAEHMARQHVGPSLRGAAPLVPVAPGLLLSDLVEEHAGGEAIRARLERDIWLVDETRYFASGAVELVGTLSLQQLLKPWVLERALPRSDAHRSTAFTGFVIDTRGLDFRPCYAPVLARHGPRGIEPLLDGSLWEDVALSSTPAVYVTDPASPAAMRAGDKPLFLQAVEIEDGVLVLAEMDAVRFRTATRDSRLVGEGALVVVVGS